MPKNSILVYHYINAKYGLEAIRKRRLKISRIMGLNCPFEFLGVNLEDSSFREPLQAANEEMSV